jgi:hypothetical protein
MANYFALAGLIIARLKEQLPDVPLSTIWSLAEIQETKDPTPRLQVLFDTDVVGASTTNGSNHAIEHVWTVLVMARNVEDDAGPLIPHVITALAGWKPTPAHSYVKRVDAGVKPDRSAGGVYYFPISFSTKFAFASMQ